MRLLNVIKYNAPKIALFAGLLITAACNVEDISKIFQTYSISGSVGDGPVTGAQVVATDAAGGVAGVSMSDSRANYSVVVSLNSNFPVLVTSTGGTDVVTGTEPDFTMVAIATDSAEDTVNINPFSTLIVMMAQAMPGGLTAANLSTANQTVLQRFNFGLDSALVPDPMTTIIDENNVAVIVKASEALGETLRRTRSVLQMSGVDITGNAIMADIAVDMTDGVLDGRDSNGGSNPLIAATVNVVSAQVLVEALVNKLKVSGADATVQLDTAINLTMPGAIATTADVAITAGMLAQARTAVAAALAFGADANLSALAAVLETLPANSFASDIETSFPADAGSVFDGVIAALATSGNNQFEAINAIVRSGI